MTPRPRPEGPRRGEGTQVATPSQCRETQGEQQRRKDRNDQRSVHHCRVDGRGTPRLDDDGDRYDRRVKRDAPPGSRRPRGVRDASDISGARSSGTGPYVMPSIGGFLVDDESPTEGRAEPVERVVREDILAGGEELVDHRVVLGHELDHQAGRKVREEVRQTDERAGCARSPDDGRGRGRAATSASARSQQRPSFAVGPAQPRTRVAEIRDAGAACSSRRRDG